MTRNVKILLILGGFGTLGYLAASRGWFTGKAVAKPEPPAPPAPRPVSPPRVAPAPPAPRTFVPDPRAAFVPAMQDNPLGPEPAPYQPPEVPQPFDPLNPSSNPLETI
jgi:hypothetical protein